MDSKQIRDASVRKAYQKAISSRGFKGARKNLIDVVEAADIVVSAFDGRGIAAREFIDLKRIYDHADLGSKATNVIGGVLSDWKERHKVLPSAHLLQGKALDNVRETLTAGTKKISFRNPNGGFYYHSGSYAAISKLIVQGHIAVFFDPSGETGNFYFGHGAKNVLVVSRVPDLQQRKSIMVHEATHAIQDWSNWTMRRDGMEADAFIADATYYRRVRGARKTASGQFDQILKRADEAAQVVLNGDSLTLNRWNAVREAVTKHSGYSKTTQIWDNAKRDEGVKFAKGELKLFLKANGITESVIKKLDAAGRLDPK